MRLSPSAKILFILGSISLWIVLGIYYYLGGFNKVEIKFVNKDDYVIAGHYFEGQYDSDTVRNLLSTTKSYIDNGQLAGILTVVNFKKNETRQGQVKQLIGVASDHLKKMPPDGLTMDTFRVAGAVRVIIRRYPSVMPKPASINESIRHFAEEHDLGLGDYTIEQYVSEKEMWIDAPVLRK